MDPQELDQMTIEQRLDLMEKLWVSLTEKAHQKLLRPWHGEVLASRAMALAEGRTAFTPWEEAKQRLRRIW